MTKQLITEATIKEWYAKYNVIDPSEKAYYDNIINTVPFGQKYLGRIIKWHKLDGESLGFIVDTLNSFEKEIKNVSNKDIYSKKYESIDNVIQELENLPKWFDKINIKKEYEKLLSKYKNETFKVVETDKYMLIYIGSYAASVDFCYYPRKYNDYLRENHTHQGSINNGWCIGQPNLRDYFDSQKKKTGLYFLMQYKDNFDQSCIYILHSNGNFSRHDVANYPVSGYNNETEPGIMKLAYENEKVKKLFEVMRKYDFNTTNEFLTFEALENIDISSLTSKELIKLVCHNYDIDLTEEEVDALVTIQKEKNSYFINKYILPMNILAFPKKEYYYIWGTTSTASYKSLENCKYAKMVYNCKTIGPKAKQYFTGVSTSMWLLFRHNLTFDDIVYNEADFLNTDWNVIEKIGVLLPYIDYTDKTKLKDLLAKFFVPPDFKNTLFYKIFRVQPSTLYNHSNGRLKICKLTVDMWLDFLDNFEKDDSITFSAWSEKITPKNEYENVLLTLIKNQVFNNGSVDSKILQMLNVSNLETLKDKIYNDKYGYPVSTSSVFMFFLAFPELTEKYETYKWLGEKMSQLDLEDMYPCLKLLDKLIKMIPEDIIKELNKVLSPDYLNFKYNSEYLERLTMMYSVHENFINSTNAYDFFKMALSSRGTTLYKKSYWFFNNIDNSKQKDIINFLIDHIFYNIDTNINTYRTLLTLSSKFKKIAELIEPYIEGALSLPKYINPHIAKILTEEQLAKIMLGHSLLRQLNYNDVLIAVEEFSITFFSDIYTNRNKFRDITANSSNVLEFLINIKTISNGDEKKVLNILSSIKHITTFTVKALQQVDNMETIKWLDGADLDNAYFDTLSKEQIQSFMAEIKGNEKYFCLPSRIAACYIDSVYLDAYLKHKDELINVYKNSYLYKIFDNKYDFNYISDFLSRFYRYVPIYHSFLSAKTVADINTIDLEKMANVLKKLDISGFSNSSPYIVPFLPHSDEIASAATKALKRFETFVIEDAIALDVLLRITGHALYEEDTTISSTVFKKAKWICKNGNKDTIHDILSMMSYYTFSTINEIITILDSLNLKHAGYLMHSNFKTLILSPKINIVAELDAQIPSLLDKCKKLVPPHFHEVFADFAVKSNTAEELVANIDKALEEKTKPKVPTTKKETTVPLDALNKEKLNGAITKLIVTNNVIKETKDYVFVQLKTTTLDPILTTIDLPSSTSPKYITLVAFDKNNVVNTITYTMHKNMETTPNKGGSTELMQEIKKAFFDWSRTQDGFAKFLSTEINGDVYFAVYNNDKHFVWDTCKQLSLYETISFNDLISIYQMVVGSTTINNEIVEYFKQNANINRTYATVSANVPNYEFFTDLAVLCCISRNIIADDLSEIQRAKTSSQIFSEIAKKVFNVEIFTNNTIDTLPLDNAHKLAIRHMLNL